MAGGGAGPDDAMFSQEGKAAVDKHIHELKEQFPNFDELVEEARLATEAEHDMSLIQAVRKYPNAIGWSMLLSTALVMEGP